MFELIPAILPESLKDIEHHLDQLGNQIRLIQIDVVDGVFAPHLSWPYTENGKEEFAEILSHTKNLPHEKEYDFEIDLMVVESVTNASAWIDIGIVRIVIHTISPDSYEALLYLQSNRGEHLQVGIGLPVSSHAETLQEFEGLFDYVQVMGIDHIGKQGEPFDRRACSLISSLHARYPDTPLQLVY